MNDRSRSSKGNGFDVRQESPGFQREGVNFARACRIWLPLVNDVADRQISFGHNDQNVFVSIGTVRYGFDWSLRDDVAVH